MAPKVSVIITIYNREKYIEDCARTLFEQTLNDVELLFVDDASTDDSVMVLRKLLENYPKRKELTRIICLEKNGGRAVARQTGIDHLTGDYVIHVDSDDWVDFDMLEKLYEKAKKNHADIVGCNVTHEYRNYKRIFCQDYSDDMEENISEDWKGLNISAVKKNNLFVLKNKKNTVPDQDFYMTVRELAELVKGAN